MTLAFNNPRTTICGRTFYACGRDRVTVSIVEDSSEAFRYAFYRTKDGTFRSGPALRDPEVAGSFHAWLETTHACPGLADQLDHWMAAVRRDL